MFGPSFEQQILQRKERSLPKNSIEATLAKLGMFYLVRSVKPHLRMNQSLFQQHRSCKA